jgi:hypothetical protein
MDLRKLNKNLKSHNDNIATTEVQNSNINQDRCKKEVDYSTSFLLQINLMLILDNIYHLYRLRNQRFLSLGLLDCLIRHYTNTKLSYLLLKGVYRHTISLLLIVDNHPK